MFKITHVVKFIMTICLGLLGCIVDAPAESVPKLSMATPASSQDAKQVIDHSFQEDVAAQTFRDAKHCQESGIKLEQLSNNVKICRASHTADGQACATQEERLSQAVQAKDGRVALSNCSGDPEIVQTQYHAAVYKAAASGDDDAQLCFIQGWFSLASERDVADYKANATGYIKQAFARGDWRIVKLLIDGSESSAHGGAGLMGNLPDIGSPLTIYRNYRLLELGATGKYRTSIAYLAKDEGNVLTSDQAARADAWAHQEYNRYFSKSPRLSSPPNTCISVSQASGNQSGQVN